MTNLELIELIEIAYEGRNLTRWLQLVRQWIKLNKGTSEGPNRDSFGDLLLRLKNEKKPFPE